MPRPQWKAVRQFNKQGKANERGPAQLLSKGGQLLLLTLDLIGQCRMACDELLHRCLATTNIIENPHAGVRLRTRRACRWRDGTMVRWMASGLLATGKKVRKIMGRRDR